LAGQPSLDKTAGPTGSDILVQRRGVDCGGWPETVGDGQGGMRTAGTVEDGWERVRAAGDGGRLWGRCLIM